MMVVDFTYPLFLLLFHDLNVDDNGILLAFGYMPDQIPYSAFLKELEWIGVT
jgi:hypothetical protein